MSKVLYEFPQVSTSWTESCASPIMRLVILDNYDLVSEWAAKYICNRIIKFKPGQDRYFSLGLPTGINHTFYFYILTLCTVVEEIGSFFVNYF